MKTMSLLFFLVLFSGLSACENKNTETLPTLPKTLELSPAAQTVISGANHFGVELFTRVALSEGQNMAISPLSAGAALTMLLNGTADATFSQIRTLLRYPESMSIREINRAYKSLVSQLLIVDPAVELALANAAFYRNDFQVHANFLTALQSDFDATVEGLDFANQAAVDRINRWASDNTKGKIPKVIESISPLMRLFLMNALYFQGNWSYAFPREQTMNRNFFLTPLQQVQVPTMHAELSVKSVFNSQYHAVELPYGRGNFSMIVVVPQNQELHPFLERFTPAIWDNITSSLDSQQHAARLKVYLPRFRFSYRQTLNPFLIDMGMVNAFDPNLANLTGISDVRDLFVHFVKQNTHIEVNEEGTTAAAVTTIGVGVTSVGPPPFVADRPFLFFIRERTSNTLLFAGAIHNPLQ